MFSYKRNPYDSSSIERLFDMNLINRVIGSSIIRGFDFDKNWEDAFKLPNFDEYDFIPSKNAKIFDRSIADEFIPEIKKMVGQDDVISGGYIIYPPTGYLGWHTNYNVPCKRLYITYASEDKKSFFRYRHPETKEIITDYDDIGITIREFNVFDKPPYFWHCVGSDCVRISFGYRINPPEINNTLN